MEFPVQDELSVNQAADHCNIDRQEFRKLVKAFEIYGTKLPRRDAGQGETRKAIPAEFLYIFENAALYMQVNEFGAEAAMQAAFRRRSIRDMEQVVEMVAKITPFLKLPRDIRSAAEGLSSLLGQKQTVQVDLRNVPDIRAALEVAERRAVIHWWAFLVVVILNGILLVGTVSAVRLDRQADARLASKVNTMHYQLLTHVNRTR